MQSCRRGERVNERGGVKEARLLLPLRLLLLLSPLFTTVTRACALELQLCSLLVAAVAARLHRFQLFRSNRSLSFVCRRLHSSQQSRARRYKRKIPLHRATRLRTLLLLCLLHRRCRRRRCLRAQK